ncbi:MAG: IS200/IS605 family transposase [Peptoclostridium sp.]|uniref:IS200/IS605 family transposase n=1 Tax=Peptoclostridium sp. TaxID=1904860 RepID=UPI00139AF964|nr:IS200/IS605 family transposase [Peptoclostridium sp.]MZQ75409.1 IS200/IS605 family transposase [Peptoclostridium sp.]
MNDDSYSKNRHACFKLTYHLVVVTKYRHKCITPDMLWMMQEITQGFLENWGCTLIEFNGEADHIHLLFEATPQVQLSKLVNSYKTVTSRAVRKEFSEHLAQYYWKPYFWSNSYMVLSTGGATIETIKKYIQQQDVPKQQ